MSRSLSFVRFDLLMSLVHCSWQLPRFSKQQVAKYEYEFESPSPSPSLWQPSHSFICSLCCPSSRFVYFYPKTIWLPDDFLQFCICVSLGIQFLFITHSAAKLFLNCPYQLRNEIYYLACVYRQCQFLFSWQSRGETDSRQRPKLLLPHHYQPRRRRQRQHPPSTVQVRGSSSSFISFSSFIAIISFNLLLQQHRHH